ncbi:GMC oxidoreductase-domain-containing protein [Rhizoctonia solani]|nr:GMC oxidoreductase-domain-containing protein [Rhizoctonia solani]
MAEHPVEVDIIFVGGGTSACVAAGRLAAANPEVNILLIEQGPNNLNEPAVVTPALFLSHCAPNSKTALYWMSSKSPATNNRVSRIATGGILGGGSSINFLMYSRGAASDYDDWDTPGWGSKDLIPLLQKIETYHIASGRDNHGYEGPVNVSYGDYFSQVAKEYLDVCPTRGVPRLEEIMDLRTGHGCARLAKYINPITGRREDAAHRYIHTQSHNRRLHIMTKTVVTRILFEGNKAVGVEVIGNKRQDPDADSTPRKIIARKLVVVSAGALGSAIVLQRSGVGEAARLSKLGVDVVADLPVGANYEDHSSCIIAYRVPDDTETLDPVLEENKEVLETYLAQFAHGKGFLTTNANDAGSKVRPTPDELKEIGPAFNELWKRHFEPAPDKAVFVQTMINGFLGPRAAVPANSRSMMVANILAYPASRGHVYINSTDPYAPPDFHAGFIEDRADLEAHIWMYKKSREILRRMPSYRGEYAHLHPRFPADSSAVCVHLEKAHSPSIEDLVYTEEDNAAIEHWVREYSDTTWHSIATVRMKPKENGGCVDSRLNVYGTNSLKVADLSIIPSNVGANTYSTALLVGEKAALIIAEELGLNAP